MKTYKNKTKKNKKIKSNLKNFSLKKNNKTHNKTSNNNNLTNKQNFLYSQKNNYEEQFKIKNITFKNKILKNFVKDKKKFINTIKKNKNLIRDFNVPYNYIEYDDTYKLNNKQILDKEKFMFKDYVLKKNIKPQNDFYNWVLSPWFEKVNKSYFSKSLFYNKYDIFRISEQKVLSDLFSVLNVYMLNELKKNPKNKNIINMNNYLNSIIKYGIYSHEGDDIVLSHMIKSKNDVEDFVENDDLYGLLAYLNSNEMINKQSPIYWSVQIDIKNPKIYKSSILPTQLPYYDLDLYIENKEDTEERKKYKRFFNKRYWIYTDELFNSTFGKNNHKFKSDSLYDIGKLMYLSMKDRNLENDDKITNYNIVKTDESLKLYGFDFKKFCEKLGYKKVPSTFIVPNLSYLKNIMEILNKNWKSEEWKAWYVYIVIRSQIHFNKRLYPLYFDFYKKYVKKIVSRLPIYILPIFICSFAFNKKISEIYEKSIYNKEYVNYVEDMFINMKNVFKNMIKECEWLSPKAKKNGLLKIEYLKLSIGSSKNLLDDPDIEYRENDVWYNLSKVFEYRKNIFVSIDGKSFNKKIPYYDWVNQKITGKQLYLVNAFYTPTSNDIYIPLAIIQYPFINIEKSFEYNLSNIGYTLAHEMAHCLDNTGRLFDYTGKFNNFWNSNDIKIFNKKKIDIIKQYEYLAKKDGIIFNASPGVGEDIADIIGLKILVILLRNDHLIRLNYSVENKASIYKNFFINYTLCLKQQINKGSETSSKVIDIHPLAKYRVNVPLSRIEIFRFLYDVKKGDGMYWNNMDTIY